MTWSFEDAPAEWELFSCGTFEDDVAIVREARPPANPPRAIGSIAAGVQEFASEVDESTASTGSRSGSRVTVSGPSWGRRKRSS